MFENLRTDLGIESENSKNFKLISFNDLINKNYIKKKLITNINYFINNKNYKHIFIVGLGNENNTADSVGPKTINKIRINGYYEKLGIKTNNKVYALEPGVLINTGIEVNKIIKSIVKEIKVDLVILIDSYVTKDFKYLNKSIEISNEGLIPGTGLSNNSKIDYKYLKTDVIVIGVPTAIELKNNSYFLLSSKDIDFYVDNISSIIADAINQLFKL